jgi:predicted RecA/RadA family phage recombinase
MKNYVQPGKTLTLTAPYDVAAGAACKVGSIIAIAASAVLSTARGEFDVVGVFDVAKATGETWTEGLIIYWDNTAKLFTSTSTSNTKAGVAVGNDAAGTMAATADTVGRLRLNGSF